MKKINFLLAFTLLLATTTGSFGQATGKRISHTTVAIFNKTDKDLSFKLGLPGQNPETFRIEPQEKWISPTYPLHSRPLFSITTADKKVSYSLRLNNTYMIFWNTRKKYWDLVKIRNTD